MSKNPLLILIAGLVATSVSAAETPLQCTQGAVQRLTITEPSSTSRMRFRGTYPASAGLDPLADGLTIDLAYAPETDPANDLFSATIPASSFTVSGSVIKYRDPAGAIGGITRIKIVSKGTADRKILVIRQGTPLTAHEGVVRVVLTSGTDCVRTCATTCTGPSHRVSCRASRDTAFCGTKSGCEVLNQFGNHCMLPYPSSFFEATDVGTDTGRRINYQGRTLPVNRHDVHIQPAKWNDLDGFSPGTIGTVLYPQGVDLVASGVPSQTNFAASVGAGSPTILLDADTGERIEHFAENDVASRRAWSRSRPRTRCS
jgi:hypothetical protein